MHPVVPLPIHTSSSSHLGAVNQEKSLVGYLALVRNSFRLPFLQQEASKNLMTASYPSEHLKCLHLKMQKVYLGVLNDFSRNVKMNFCENCHGRLFLSHVDV